MLRGVVVRLEKASRVYSSLFCSSGAVYGVQGEGHVGIRSSIF